MCDLGIIRKTSRQIKRLYYVGKKLKTDNSVLKLSFKELKTLAENGDEEAQNTVLEIQQGMSEKAARPW